MLKIKRFMSFESGATSIEYALIAPAYRSPFLLLSAGLADIFKVYGDGPVFKMMPYFRHRFQPQRLEVKCSDIAPQYWGSPPTVRLSRLLNGAGDTNFGRYPNMRAEAAVDEVANRLRHDACHGNLVSPLRF